MEFAPIKMLAQNLQNNFHFVFDNLQLLCRIESASKIFGTALNSLKRYNISF